MSMTWQTVSMENLPPEGEPVHTRIKDEKGARNEAILKRRGNLWFFPDDSMYVYYTPTEWAKLTDEGKKELRAQADRIMRAAVEKSESLTRSAAK